MEQSPVVKSISLHRRADASPKPHPTHEQEEQADEQVVLVVVSLVEFGNHLLELIKRPEVHKRFLPTNVADHP